MCQESEWAIHTPIQGEVETAWVMHACNPSTWKRLEALQTEASLNQ